MKIVQERLGKEQFLELSISEKEFELIKEYMIISKLFFIHGEPMNVGVKLQIGGEEDED